MNYLIFDVETTGLPEDYRAPIDAVDNWPRVVQLAYCLFNKNGVLVQASHVIKPEGYIISDEVAELHGINHETALNGVDMHFALDSFIEVARMAHIFIAHNINFDRKVIGCELFRSQIFDVLHGAPKVCTMMKSTKHCEIAKTNGKGGFKWPQLQELHKHLFGFNFDGAHNAIFDVLATKKCFIELMHRDVINKEYIIEKLEKSIAYDVWNSVELKKEVELLKAIDNA